MIKTLLFVGLGSFLGGISRFGLTRWVQSHGTGDFPYGTLAVNLLGCLLIGVFYGWFDRARIFDPDLRLLLTVGFCGGFTTFSTFANEGLSLFQSGNFFAAVAYAVVSVVVGLAMVYLGQLLVRILYGKRRAACTRKAGGHCPPAFRLHAALKRTYCAGEISASTIPSLRNSRGSSCPLSCSREISQILIEYSAIERRSSASSRLFCASRNSMPESSWIL